MSCKRHRTSGQRASRHFETKLTTIPSCFPLRSRRKAFYSPVRCQAKGKTSTAFPSPHIPGRQP